MSSVTLTGVEVLVIIVVLTVVLLSLFTYLVHLINAVSERDSEILYLQQDLDEQLESTKHLKEHYSAKVAELKAQHRSRMQK